MPGKSYARIIGESFRECLGGYAACGLLRKNFHRLPDLEIYLTFIFWVCCEKPCLRTNVSAIRSRLLEIPSHAADFLALLEVLGIK
jgi:hypothetical protein